jgi:hypothetical protein
VSRRTKQQRDGEAESDGKRQNDPKHAVNRTV